MRGLTAGCAFVSHPEVRGGACHGNADEIVVEGSNSGYVLPVPWIGKCRSPKFFPPAQEPRLIQHFIPGESAIRLAPGVYVHPCHADASEGSARLTSKMIPMVQP